MTSPYAFNVNDKVSFVIKNTSSINRSIKVFNTKIGPGNILDLMRVPGVTEDDVRAELTKGTLKNLIAGGSITVISSTLNLTNSRATNLAELSTVVDGGQPNLAKFFIETTKSYYILDKNNADTVDGLFVLATASGTGRWLLESTPNPHWTRQYTWYVNNSTGNDENDGASALTPMKTLKAIAARLVETDAADYTINVLANVPSTDTFRLSNRYSSRLGASGVAEYTFTLKGQLTTIYSGVVGSATVSNPDGYTQASLSTVGAPFAANVGKLIVVTSGASAGAYATILKETASGVARVSNWWNTVGAFGAGFPAGLPTAAPAPGDTYTIVNRTVFAGTLNGAGSGDRTLFKLEDLDITGGAINAGGAQFGFVRTRHTGSGFIDPGGGSIGAVNFGVPTRITMNGCTIHFGNSTDPDGFFVPNFFITASGCSFINVRIGMEKMGRIEMSNSVLQTSLLQCNSNVAPFDASEVPLLCPVGGQVGIAAGTYGLGVFDTPTGYNAIEFNNGALASFRGPIYGDGNLGKGVVVRAGGRLFIKSTITPTLKATGQELEFDNAATAIPPLVAGGAVPAASALTTWANWAAGPFSRAVVGYASGSSITNTAQ